MKIKHLREKSEQLYFSQIKTVKGIMALKDIAQHNLEHTSRKSIIVKKMLI